MTSEGVLMTFNAGSSPRVDITDGQTTHGAADKAKVSDDAPSTPFAAKRFGATHIRTA
jgi:hypothetical protein